MWAMASELLLDHLGLGAWCTLVHEYAVAEHKGKKLLVLLVVAPLGTPAPEVN